MKKAKTKVDFTKDKMNILGQEMDINFRSNGHYSIPITKSYEVLDKFIEENAKIFCFQLIIYLKDQLAKNEKLQKTTKAIWSFQCK